MDVFRLIVSLSEGQDVSGVSPIVGGATGAVTNVSVHPGDIHVHTAAAPPLFAAPILTTADAFRPALEYQVLVVPKIFSSIFVDVMEWVDGGVRLIFPTGHYTDRRRQRIALVAIAGSLLWYVSIRRGPMLAGPGGISTYPVYGEVRMVVLPPNRVPNRVALTNSFLSASSNGEHESNSGSYLFLTFW